MNTRLTPAPADDLVERLQAVDISWSETGELCAHAATRIQSDAEKIATLEAQVKTLRDVANGYRAAVSFISADSWDGCSDCIEILKAARCADVDHELHEPDDVARELKRIRMFTRQALAATEPKV